MYKRDKHLLLHFLPVFGNLFVVSLCMSDALCCVKMGICLNL